MSDSGIKHFRRKLEQRRAERYKQNNDLDQKTTTFEFESQVESFLINYLNDPLVDLPITTDDIKFKLDYQFQTEINNEFINKLLFKFSNTYKLIDLKEILIKRKLVNTFDEEEEESETNDNIKKYKITNIDSERIDAYLKQILKIEVDKQNERNKSKQKCLELSNRILNKNPIQFLERLLAQPSHLELESRKFKTELNELLMESTTKERLEMDRFKSVKSHVQEYCPHGVKDECFRFHFDKNMLHKKCEKIHFKRILKPHTDVSLGDCSFLNTCYNINNCKYIHYEVDMEDVNQEITLNSQALVNKINISRKIPPQWLQCDLRTIDMTVLGKFSGNLNKNKNIRTLGSD